MHTSSPFASSIFDFSHYLVSHSMQGPIIFHAGCNAQGFTPGLLCGHLTSSPSLFFRSQIMGHNKELAHHQLIIMEYGRNWMPSLGGPLITGVCKHQIKPPSSSLKTGWPEPRILCHLMMVHSVVTPACIGSLFHPSIPYLHPGTPPGHQNTNTYFFAAACFLGNLRLNSVEFRIWNSDCFLSYSCLYPPTRGHSPMSET